MTSRSSPTVVFHDGLLIDGSGPDPVGQVDVLVADGTIQEVSETRISAKNALEYDLAGKTIMPGLIDLHIHPFLTNMNLMKLEEIPVSLVTAQASVVLKALLDRRKATQPLGLPSCGSVFRNPPGDHAARLIEVAGLKGARIGGAEVSEKHANFIINVDHASATDVEQLIHYVQQTVADQHGVELIHEVRIVGNPES